MSKGSGRRPDVVDEDRQTAELVLGGLDPGEQGRPLVTLQATTTAAPLPGNTSATAQPTPAPAPVTTAVCPSSRI